ncbi:PAS domain S-box protein [Christiangramia portivictoriae]|uniref:PAS domain S-box protein n=1 Tax=Christiangramia portivictoriae TaxID=326069 RepID=UPI00047D8795|nr:PAS domain S-box protein [Christiangramia portivictoriae]
MSGSSRIHLLHVEDSKTDAYLLQRHLENTDIQIYLATSKKEFEYYLHNHSFDIILCDHYLPDLYSNEALETVRKMDSVLPFIIFSGTLPPGTAVKLMEKGANDFIFKDRPERLIPAILNAISRCKLEREREQMEKQIRFSENRFRKLVESSHEIICILNREAEIIYCSPSIRNLFNDHTKVLGCAIGQIIDFENPVRFLELFNECKNKKQRIEDLVYVKLLNSVGVFRCILRNHLNDEGINGIIIKFRDITDEISKDKQIRERDEKLRAFYENSIDGIIMAKTNGIITSANPAMCRMLGMQESELIGQHRNIIIDTDKDRVAELLEERRKIGKAKSELNLIRKDGTVFPAEVASSILPFKRDGRKIEKTATIIRDITEQKENVRQINDTAEKLQYAEKIARIGYLEINLKANTVYCSGEVSNILAVENCDDLK